MCTTWFYLYKAHKQMDVAGDGASPDSTYFWGGTKGLKRKVSHNTWPDLKLWKHSPFP